MVQSLHGREERDAVGQAARKQATLGWRLPSQEYSSSSETSETLSMNVLETPGCRKSCVTAAKMTCVDDRDRVISRNGVAEARFAAREGESALSCVSATHRESVGRGQPCGDLGAAEHVTRRGRHVGRVARVVVRVDRALARYLVGVVEIGD